MQSCGCGYEQLNRRDRRKSSRYFSFYDTDNRKLLAGKT